MLKHYSFIVLILSVFACKKQDILTSAPEENELLDGPMAGLSYSEMAQFSRGDAAFSKVFTANTGLGSIFVASSCVACHAGDGKGHPSTTLTRFGQSDNSGNQFLHLGGPQLQNRAIPGFVPEQIPLGATSSKFTPPAVTGLGLVTYVSDADLLALADEFDANGDGISGVPNWISLPNFVTPFATAAVNSGKYIGRFGKKAGAHNLLHQTVNAYHQDMGIASSYLPLDIYTGLASDPEVNTAEVNDLVFYLHTLKAPLPRNTSNAEVIKGKEIFTQINCSGCHVPSLKTGTAPVAALSNQVFYPYSDFLLHDMGNALDDGYTEGSALTSEWRTPPLWGLGLSPIAQGGEYFLLHDGRAKSIEDAILYHGGEALKSKESFQNLSETDKQALLAFLKSL